MRSRASNGVRMKQPMTKGLLKLQSFLRKRTGIDLGVWPRPKFSSRNERCHRVLGLNPGPHTLHGTNTYLVGAGHALVLVDAGEASTSAAWVAALLQVLQRGDRRITDVLLSHGHFDHSGGVSALLAEMQRRGMPLPNVHKRRITASGDGVGEECGCYPARGFPCLHLRDGQEFTCPGEGGGE